jgi:hypothetical protein
VRYSNSRAARNGQARMGALASNAISALFTILR